MGEQDDRYCRASGCTTKLSRYNASSLCYVHADEQSRTRFERSPDETPSVIYHHRKPSSVRDDRCAYCGEPITSVDRGYVTETIAGPAHEGCVVAEKIAHRAARP